MNLDSPEFQALINLIKDSFRVRQNHKPLYIDLAHNLERISSPQHQVVFGRRGSGKSCLFVHYLNNAASRTVIPIYIMADEYKRLTYPDILIRLLIEIFEALPVCRRWLTLLPGRKIPTLEYARELRRLLELADESEVVEDRKRSLHQSSGVQVGRDGVAEANAGSAVDSVDGRTSKFKERKLDTLERHLRDYKRAIGSAIDQSNKVAAYVFVDDFYLLPPRWHPDVLDYLHRLFRDTAVFVKMATIRHRTRLIRTHPQTIGIELAQDFEEITLDRTLEDLESTQAYLGQMLSSMARQAGIENILEDNFNPEALQALTLASGGVPRDFLTIFVNSIEASLGENKVKWLTPKYIYKGAGRLVYQTKLRNFREDANGDAAGIERLLHDLWTFCLKEKRKTAFLISQEEAQRYPREHDLVQQLMDFKLIHVVEPDTSAASGRPGRYEAYTLDFSLFMEPRKRNIEIVEFWRIDDNRRRTGLRESPVYQLRRAGEAFDDASREANAEQLVEEGASKEPEAVVAKVPAQGSLFSI